MPNLNGYAPLYDFGRAGYIVKCSKSGLMAVFYSTGLTGLTGFIYFSLSARTKTKKSGGIVCSVVNTSVSADLVFSLSSLLSAGQAGKGKRKS